MRTAVGVAVVIICLGLTGCSLFGKKQGAQNTNTKPFLGTSTPGKTEPVAISRDSEGPPSGANGLLAGQVIASDTGRPIKAFIQYKNLDRDESKEADLDIETNEEGYFVITQLAVGGHYELEARAKAGGDLISQKQFVQPPRANLLLRLDKKFTTKNTKPIPDAPSTAPSKKKTAGTESSQDRTSAVIIEAPIRLPSENSPSGPGSNNASGASGSTTPNPANIAREEFNRIQPPPTVDVPSPPPLPGRSQWDSVPDSPREQTPAVERSPGSVRLPNLPRPVPFCELYGTRLENFALYDLDGNIWEYARDRRKGGLILLDFWYSTCPYCLHCISRLEELHETYGRYGLDVIGIACETGPIEQQRSNVRGVRGRYKMQYKTLLSGGGRDPNQHPIVDQFQVQRYPYLVLIDSSGNIIWSKEGLDDGEYEKLRRMIANRLTRQTQP